MESISREFRTVTVQRPLLDLILQVTKRNIARVNKTWYALVSPFLYEHIILGRSKALQPLLDGMKRSTETIDGEPSRPISRWTQRLDVSMREHTKLGFRSRDGRTGQHLYSPFQPAYLDLFDHRSWIRTETPAERAAFPQMPRQPEDSALLYSPFYFHERLKRVSGGTHASRVDQHKQNHKLFHIPRSTQFAEDRTCPRNSLRHRPKSCSDV